MSIIDLSQNLVDLQCVPRRFHKHLVVGSYAFVITDKVDIPANKVNIDKLYNLNNDDKFCYIIKYNFYFKIIKDSKTDEFIKIYCALSNIDKVIKLLDLKKILISPKLGLNK